MNTPLSIPHAVLQEAREFFEECGAEGHEGTALICRAEKSGSARLVIPPQVAGGEGAWVEVPLAGKLMLAAQLKGDERYVARIHSHPGEAFHSPTDDANPVLLFEGALSIVVPYYGLGLRRGLDNCAVFERRQRRWLPLPPGLSRDSVVKVL